MRMQRNILRILSLNLVGLYLARTINNTVRVLCLTHSSDVL